MKLLTIYIFVIIFTSGCSAWILQSGQHRDLLKDGTTRQEIIEALGKPIESKTTEYQIIDYYQVKGKLPSNESAISGHIQGVMLTFGAAELIALPITIGMLPGQMTAVHDLHIYYDKSEKYISHTVKKSLQEAPNKKDASNPSSPDR